MLTILKDWRNASEDTAVERWKNLGMLENLDQEEAKKCAACFDLMGHWIVDNSETLKKYDSCKEFDNVVFPIIKGVIVNEGGFKEGFLPEKILITWQEAYAKNYYRFDDILADISAEVANKLGFHPYVDLGLPSGTKWAKVNYPHLKLGACTRTRPKEVKFRYRSVDRDSYIVSPQGIRFTFNIIVNFLGFTQGKVSPRNRGPIRQRTVI